MENEHILNQRIEVRDIEENGIKITIQIDFVAKSVAIVEPEKQNLKSFVFASDKMDKIEKWQDILEAVGKAIEYGKSKLNEYLEAEKAEHDHEQF